MNKKVHSKTRRFLLLSLIGLFIFSGCATITTQYHRKNIDDHELVWAYNSKKGLKIIENDTIICTNNWNGLSDAIASVPPAYNLALSAKKKHSIGNLFKWGGFVFAIGSAIAGAAILSHEDTYTNFPCSSVGTWMLLGGTTIGMSIGMSGDYLIFRAQADAIDAVNIYNCNYQRNYLKNK